jgi:hypothetical protein
MDTGNRMRPCCIDPSASGVVSIPKVMTSPVSLGWMPSCERLEGPGLHPRRPGPSHSQPKNKSRRAGAHSSTCEMRL